MPGSERPDASERQARIDLAAALRWTARLGWHEAVANHFSVAVSDDELVSIDYRGNPNSSIVDAPYTKVMDGDFLKVLSWYDNEWGYSSRCVDLVRKLAARGL